MDPLRDWSIGVEKPCGSCAGTGRTDGKSCKRCAGTGRLLSKTTLGDLRAALRIPISPEAPSDASDRP